MTNENKKAGKQESEVRPPIRRATAGLEAAVLADKKIRKYRNLKIKIRSLVQRATDELAVASKFTK